ncbi:hypothetical protein DPMN_023182 [Dreissena polymorpha]|uniref:Uncharacterized protein n=1 Tax=Dreissena polymorpha TaxID=45954 RepID=A0A9D4LK91_DREPO|nr:hypothetical protein DPMN_023182 [Dreissena polymorpha]
MQLTFTQLSGVTNTTLTRHIAIVVAAGSAMLTLNVFLARVESKYERSGVANPTLTRYIAIVVAARSAMLTLNVFLARVDR